MNGSGYKCSSSSEKESLYYVLGIGDNQNTT